MNTDNTQGGAEPSPASAGSRPVAWAVMNGEKPLWVWYDKDAPPHAVPLYRHAGNHGERGKPALNDEEREAIEFAIRKSTRLRDGGRTGAALRGLLERLG